MPCDEIGGRSMIGNNYIPLMTLADNAWQELMHFDDIGGCILMTLADKLSMIGNNDL